MFKRNPTIINQQFMKFFFPTVMMSVALSLSVVVDGIIVGNTLGADALAAVNLVLPITLLMNSVYVLIGVGGSTLYSVALGRREHQKAKGIFTLAVLTMMGISLLVCGVGLLLCGKVAELLTPNAANLTPLVTDYLRYVMLAAPLFIVVPGLVYFLRSAGKATLASSVLIIANVVNLCLDLVYILCFNLGISGASLATATGYVVGLVVALYGLIKTKELRFCRPTGSVWTNLLAIAKTGLPSTINTAMNFFRLTCINVLVISYLGSDGVTAFSVCTSCLSIVSMFVGGSAQTMIPLLGTLYGERDFKGIRFTIKKALIITGTATLVLLLIFEAVPAQITGLFGVVNPVQVEIAVSAIRVYALSLPFMGIMFIFMCVYQVMEHRGISSLIALLEGFVLVVPAAWGLSALLGPVGIWLGFPAGEIGTLLVLGGIIFFVQRRKPELKGLFLFKEPQEEKAMDVTLIQRPEQAAELSKEVISFCLENGVSEIAASRVGVALEELTVHTIEEQNTGKREKYIDIRLLIDSEEITLVFKDNGAPSDPLKDVQEREEFSNVRVALSISNKISYDYILGMNRLIATIKI